MVDAAKLDRLGRALCAAPGGAGIVRRVDTLADEPFGHPRMGRLSSPTERKHRGACTGVRFRVTLAAPLTSIIRRLQNRIQSG